MRPRPDQSGRVGGGYRAGKQSTPDAIWHSAKVLTSSAGLIGLLQKRGRPVRPSPFFFFATQNEDHKPARPGPESLAAVGVVFYVYGVVHCCCGGVGFFVGGDLGFVLEAGAYVVEAF